MRSVILTLALLASCSTQPPPSAVSGLAGTTWVAEDLNGAVPAEGVKRPTAEFGVDGRIAGDASCNRYSGPYTQKGETLTFGPMASTRMACAGPGSEQESKFLAVMGGVNRGQVADGKLTLSGSAGRVVFGPASAAATGAVRFRCDTGEEITVSFQGATARLTFPGGEDAGLVQAPVADGFLYESPRNSLRGKGDTVTWNRARMAPKTCQKT